MSTIKTDVWTAFDVVAKGHPLTPRGTWENFGETRGGVEKSSVLKQKSVNISETRKGGGKVTMESL